MANLSRASSHRIAFHPCCADDIEGPRALLQNYADEIIFCDRNPKLSRCAKRVEGLRNDLAAARFTVDDVREVLPELPTINVLFYRCDTDGEGGSGVFILGDSVLHPHIGTLPGPGWFDHNRRGGNFRKMIGQNGLNKHGWNFAKLAE
jgi:hypothetical protein